MQRFAFSLTFDGMTGQKSGLKIRVLPAAYLCVLRGLALNLFKYLPLNCPFKLI